MPNQYTKAKEQAAKTAAEAPPDPPASPENKPELTDALSKLLGQDASKLTLQQQVQAIQRISQARDRMVEGDTFKYPPGADLVKMTQGGVPLVLYEVSVHTKQKDAPDVKPIRVWRVAPNQAVGALAQMLGREQMKYRLIARPVQPDEADKPQVAEVA